MVSQQNVDLFQDTVGQTGSGHRHRYGSGFRALTLATLVMSYLLIVLGDTVRVTESGMGCASWPLCNGGIGLAGTYHAMLEQSHRYVAAVVTTLIIAVFAIALRRARHDRLVFGGATAAIVLIAVQVVLGALTVFARNAGWTVALHLAGAWLVAAAVTVIAVASWRTAAGAHRRPTPLALSIPSGRFGAAAPAVLFALSVSGMLVLHEGASNACPGWPLCPADDVPGGQVALQYLHRSLVLAATVVIVAAVIAAWRSRLASRLDRVLAGAALVLLAATAALGAIVATTGSPDWAQDLHLAIASGLWITVVAMATPARTSSLHADVHPADVHPADASADASAA